MSYIDSFLIPVAKRHLPAYRKLARLAAKVWTEHGALAYVEALADDVAHGKSTSFPRAVKLKAGETVVFSYIVYASRAARDRINKKVMADPRMQLSWDAMPFDGKRMIMGGFKPFIQR